MSKPVDHVFMIHGYGVTPEKMWFPWLHAEIERKGVAVSVPALPDPYRPNFDTWLKFMTPFASKWTPRTLLVAHSIGGVLGLRLLERRTKVRLRAAIIVSSPFASTINVKPYVRFFERPIDWWAVRERAEEFTVMHAKDDPLVPYDHVLRYEEALGAKRFLLPNGGHFTGKKFPLLKKTVLEYLE